MEQLKAKCDNAVTLLPHYAPYFGLDGAELTGGLLAERETELLPREQQMFFAYSVSGDDYKFMGIDMKLLSELTEREIALIALANLGARNIQHPI
jgi:hypothetical protein